MPDAPASIPQRLFGPAIRELRLGLTFKALDWALRLCPPGVGRVALAQFVVSFASDSHIPEAA